MKKYVLAALLGSCSLCFSTCWAQLGLQLLHEHELPFSQAYQPAAIADQEFDKLQLQVDGDLWLGSNQFTIGSLVRGGNFIDEATKNDIIGQLSDNNRYQQGLGMGGVLNFKTGKQIWLISFSYRDHFLIHVDDSATAGLILRGNAPYAGQTIQDEDVAIRSIAYGTLGVGTAWKWDKWTLGVHPKVVWGRRADIIDELAYRLFSADNGSLISLDATYDAFSTQGDDRGWGFGLDVGASYMLNESIRIEAAVRDAGLIQWEGSESNNTVEVDYEGVVWDNFISGGDNTNNLALGDTLQQLLFPDSVRTQRTFPLPAIAQVGISWDLNERELLFSSLQYGFTRFPPSFNFPLLNIGYKRHIGSHLTLGVNGYIGGIDEYGLGILGHAYFGKKANWGLFYTMNNLLGLVVSDIAQGLSLKGGIYIRY